jgi:hypothetical protein
MKQHINLLMMRLDQIILGLLILQCVAQIQLVYYRDHENYLKIHMRISTN